MNCKNKRRHVYKVQRDSRKVKSIKNNFITECDCATMSNAACETCLMIVKCTSDSGMSGLERHACRANSGKSAKHLFVHQMEIDLTLVLS